MRVLFVSNFYPPRSMGGVELYTQGLASELQMRGHATTVLAAGDWDRGRKYLNAVVEEVQDGIPVTLLQLNWRKAADPFRYLYDNPVTGKFAGRLIERFAPDVVHVTSPSTLSASSIFTARRAQVPVVLTLADYWLICPRLTLQHLDGHICDGNVTPWQCTQCLAGGAKIYRWPSRFLPEASTQSTLKWMGKRPFFGRRRGLIGMIGDMEDRRRTLRIAFEMANVVLAISRFTKEVFARSGQLPAGEIRVHEWGLPGITGRERAPASVGAPMRVAYFGRLTPAKGVHVLLEAFSGLHGNAELHIYGGPGRENALYDAALRESSGADGRVRFHGRYEHAQMPGLLANSDVVVVPSVWGETYNLVAREALAERVPVVASRIGAIPEAVRDNENGLLCEPGNVAELRAALQRLCNDVDLQRRLSHGGFASKAIPQECEELGEIYRTLTG